MTMTAPSGPLPPVSNIVDRLRRAAIEADDMVMDDVVALFAEAAAVIEELRLLVGIRQEIDLEDAEPEGSA